MTNADTVAARTPPPKLKTPALAVLFATVFINLVGFGLVVPLLPFFAQSLKAEAWQITLMFSAYSLGQFFAEPFWGRLSDRIGRKPVLLMTLIANALGYLMLAFVPNIWLAIAVRLFTGLGAGNISTVQGYVADVTPPEQRAGRMGLIGAAFGLGFIVGPVVGEHATVGAAPAGDMQGGDAVRVSRGHGAKKCAGLRHLASAFRARIAGRQLISRESRNAAYAAMAQSKLMAPATSRAMTSSPFSQASPMDH